LLKNTLKSPPEVGSADTNLSHSRLFAFCELLTNVVDYSDCVVALWCLKVLMVVDVVDVVDFLN
jgi:hypothetical protein